MKPPGSLPVQLTSFVGRAACVDLVGRLLAENRLVSLVGPGGCGKTRLAVEVGRRAAPVAPDRVFFVDLAGLSDPGLLPGTVLRALGLREVPGHKPMETLVSRLSGRQVLIILDNCEHLAAACSDMAAQLTEVCPGTTVLSTSRERLRAQGEVVVDIEGLELPEPRGGGDDWLLQSEAGRLFVERACTGRADFALGAGDAAAVAGICQR
ncbi:MAG TPA: AAA family ATPase, partial [Acidimicrobiales bacterium]|nr:AAA family ATPase [Acidimicrobiales bacterium]